MVLGMLGLDELKQAPYPLTRLGKVRMCFGMIVVFSTAVSQEALANADQCATILVLLTSCRPGNLFSPCLGSTMNEVSNAMGDTKRRGVPIDQARFWVR